jgi:hypothetical protein
MNSNVHLRSLPDSEAIVGWARGHTIIADMPAGKAGGLGLGLNDVKLHAGAIGGRFLK